MNEVDVYIIRGTSVHSLNGFNERSHDISGNRIHLVSFLPFE